MTLPPMTAEEADAFLRGWRAAIAAAVSKANAHGLEDGESEWCQGCGEVLADAIRAIPAPTIPRAGFGVLGEG